MTTGHHTPPAPQDDAPSLVGQRIGVYDVQSLLGRGGMGEVYRARDTRLARDVAIKVLPAAFTADADRLARFEREARVLAALNHPHIAAIHAVEESNGRTCLVLELVEGETLAERLDRAGRGGARVPIPHALEYAAQMAGALEAAHEKGILHRDLKPANVKVTPEGVVKLLDFGIAKIVAADRESPDAAEASTITGATLEGVVLGTAGYMSPEQARAEPVDRRVDVWAFGCVLYEMLCGQRAFKGQTTADTLAAVLERAPDWSRLPAATPAALRRLVERCLEKDPRHRLRDLGDARIELEQIARTPLETGAEAAAVPGRGAWRWSPLAAAAVAVLATGAAAWILSSGRDTASPGDGRVTRFVVPLPAEQIIVPGFNPDLALSPDGTHLAFATLPTGNAPGGVFVRRLDGLDTRRLDADPSDYSTGPLFSPDGAFVSFVSGNAIISSVRAFSKAALSGGAAVKLADYDMFHRGDWSADGWIYWTAQYPGGIVRMRDTGGDIEPVTRLGEGERSHRFASLLPDGRALLYTVGFDGIGSYDEARIALWDPDRGAAKTLVEGGTAGVYSPSGHIVYARAGKLLAVPFDATRREVTGSAFEVLDGVLTTGNTGAASFSLSRRGDLAYLPGPAEGGRRTLVWVDRSGKEEPLPLPPASYLSPRLSPDGRTLAVEIEGPNHDFHLYDFARGVLSKVTTDGLSHGPVWHPDGTRLAFRSWQAGGMTLWWMPADRSTTPERLDPSGMRQSPVAFSPDGQFLAFDQKDQDTQDDAWVLPLTGSRTPQAVAHSRFGEGSAKFSPDGRWVAYSSDESGRPEVYVQAFPGPGPKVQVSDAGGTDPVWRRSGGELFYRRGNRMMAVSVSTSPRFTAGAPQLLWEGSYSHGSGSSCGMPGPASANYDVTADGRRFLMVRDEHGGVRATEIVVVLNWIEELRARASAAER